MSLRRLILPTLALIFTPLNLPAAEPAKPTVDFNRDIRPILFNNCVACHGPDENERKADLRLDLREEALQDGVIVPGQPEKSELVARVTSDEPGELMPPAKSGKRLTPQERQLLKDWIRQGADYSRHWAYERPKSPELPKVSDPNWAKNPIDRFVLYRLDQEGLKPSAEADKYALARRVAIDLTGLPPTVEEVDRFVRDESPQAYEKFVDAQLAKPGYGEHWARLWLDLARYADSAGYADDPPRTIWAYRDYVIRSFNANKPFDQFTIEQIAGDLLDNPTEEQLIATAFHRNTMTNNEGGTSDEEFRNAAVVDRVNTTFAVWMGTSMACAQCHTHKYDPITQDEYFGVFAIFNNTADADRRDESPTFNVGDTPEKQVKRNELEAAAKQLERQAQHQDPLLQGLLKTRAGKLRQQQGRFQPLTTVPVMAELPVGKRRVTKLQYRGNYLDTGHEVNEGVPAVFHPIAAEKPNRLDLARWLVANDNPLTARVLANRLWEEFFGQGLVRTPEEFGNQGELPSHPELLDWLAVDLQSHGWDLKRFLKQVVMSATYRQSSKVNGRQLERDPDNRLLARGPRHRLPAEVVRDQALAVAGLLSDKQFGPSVRPPQPSFGLNAAFGRTLDWQASTGEDRYRRALYTEWRRTNPYPSMVTFDAPSRETCTIRRNRTNTPLQALVLLNDPVIVEASQALARQMAKGKTPAEQLEIGFRRTLIRPPSEPELARLTDLYQELLAEYQEDRPRAEKMATEPLGPLPKGMEAAPLAALTVVANVLLNLDEAVMAP